MNPLSIVLLLCLVGVSGPKSAQAREGRADVTRATPDGDFDYQRARHVGIGSDFDGVGDSLLRVWRAVEEHAAAPRG